MGDKGIRWSANRNLWPRIDQSGGPDACWPWMGHRSPRGYGRTKRKGRCAPEEFTHRLVWEFTYGRIPRGLAVCHRCDNPPCCNPAHLFIAPNSVNIRDRHQKGRSRGPQGEHHASHKLTAAQVAEIRRLTSGPNPPSYSELARQYGLTPTGLRNAATGRTWKSVA